MSARLFEWFGWYGTAAILLAYFLLSFAYIESDSLFYQGLNATGACGVVLLSLYKRTFQTAIINLVWLSIAGVALFKLIQHL